MDKFSSAWVITVNTKADGNDAVDFYNELENLYDTHKEKHIRYICGQLEQGTTVHFQGYIQMKTKCRMSWVKKNIHGHAHIEPQRGNNDQCQHYTKKPVEGCLCEHCHAEVLKPTKLPEYPWLEFGRFTGGQGSRTDLELARDAIVSGASSKTMFMEHTVVYARNFRFTEKGMSLFSKHYIEEEKTVILHYGYSGKGKTTGVVLANPEVWIGMFGKSVWFDGYDEHEVALFDEFGGKTNQLDLETFLGLTDKIVRRVEVKGGTTMFKAKTVHITSNVHPLDWYDYKRRTGSFEAVKNRIKRIYWYSREMDVGGEPEDVTDDERFWLENDVYDEGGMVNPYKFQ